MGVYYVVPTVREWSALKVLGVPLGQLGQVGTIDTGSVGFLEVYDDLDTLRQHHPEATPLMVKTVDTRANGG
jgi:hypothetical protein